MFEKIVSFLLSIILSFAQLFGISVNNEPIIIKDYSYGASAKRQSFDLYIPGGVGSKAGLVLFIHGGAWTSGNKSTFLDGVNNLFEYGYSAATVDFRYASETVDLDGMLDDIQNAVATIREIGRENRINFNKMIVAGYSSGGHLALMYAYTRASSSAIEPVAVWDQSGPTDLSNARSYNSGINVFLDAFSYLTDVKVNSSTFSNSDVQAALKKASPISYVNRDTVPTLITHGRKDNVVPFEEGENLYNKLVANGVKTYLVAYPNVRHSIEKDPACMEESYSVLYQWAREYLGKPAK